MAPDAELHQRGDSDVEAARERVVETRRRRSDDPRSMQLITEVRRQAEADLRAARAGRRAG